MILQVTEREREMEVKMEIGFSSKIWIVLAMIHDNWG